MHKLLKIIAILLVITIGLVGVWFSLDKNTRCSFVYGKNICNFYSMMDIAPNNPSSFDEMMSLCKDMYDVPKKDSCYEFISLVFSRTDKNKAIEACNEIKGFRGVHSKEECLNKVENFKIYKSEEELLQAMAEEKQ